MNMRQVNFSQGTKRLTCWVEDVPALNRPRVELTLKGEEGRWAIDGVGNLVIDKAQLITRWAVGGLQ